MLGEVNFQLDYVLFFYNFTLLILCFLAYSFRARATGRLRWTFLALYALLNSLYGVSTILLFFMPDTLAFNVIRFCLLFFSFLFLFEFGRGQLPKWIYFIVIPMALSGGFVGGLTGINVSTRYVLALVGGFLSAYTLMITAIEETQGKSALLIASLSMGVYAALAGLFTPEKNLLLSSYISNNNFSYFLQLSKGIFIGCLSVALWLYYQQKYIKKEFRYGSRLIAVCLVIVTSGAFITKAVSDNTEVTVRKQLVTLTDLTSSSIHEQELDSLTLSSRDLQNPNYLSLKSTLEQIHKVNATCRFLYVVTRRNDKVIFMADSEPADSMDYSAPGDIYTDYPKEFDYVFNTGYSTTTKPYKDQWGYFVTAISPIRNEKTGKVIALVAADMDAAQLFESVQKAKIPPISYVMFLVVLFLLIYLYQQKNSENQMKLREAINNLEKYKLAVDTVTEHIVITDDNGIILYANKAVEAITGFQLPEIIGTKAGILWGKQMPIEIYTQMWDVIKKQKKTFTGTIRNKRKNGEFYDAAVTISPIVNSNGVVTNFVGIERDITKSVEVDRMKTEFVSLVSHQLKTPLTGIRWQLEMLLNGDSGPLNAEQQKDLKSINTVNERLIELVNALLNISRIESGRLSIEPQPTNIEELIKNTLKSLEKSRAEHKIKVILDIEENLPEINIDPDMIGQVLQNLISNSIKYTPPEGKIIVGATKDDKELTILVEDTGYGIPAEDTNKVFSKFYRGENITQITHEGTGLGLYLVKQIVEASNSRIWFKSEEGKGTTFMVAIPLAGVKAKAGVVSLQD